MVKKKTKFKKSNIRRTPALKKIRSAFGVTEYRLPNGLRVLHKRVTSAPVVAVCLTFHVGSRNEASGHTGSTHILEHLLFKDSEHFNRANGREMTSYLDWLGAYVNATTWVDRTNYFEVLPKEYLAQALELEADRMRSSRFSATDLSSEMTVVRNEYERSRNNPFDLLEEAVWQTAFEVHPYRIPTIGFREDIEGATVEKLREFYDTFYWPNNATLAVFGDISWSEALPLIKRYFAPIPRSPRPIPELAVVEPEQKKRRSVTLQRPFGISIASLTYKTPPATHKDFPAVYLLGIILAGGFSSRLQKSLVDAGLASDLSLFLPPLCYPGLMSFIAHCADGTAPQEVISVMRREMHAIVERVPEKEELARAKERLLTQIAYERDGVFTDVRAVSESLAAGDWALGYHIENDLKRIGLKDIRNAAERYLAQSQETEALLTEEPEQETTA